MLLAPTPDEAFGLTVVEAMASGLAVVAAAAGGHLETVGPVASDWMFAPGDPVAAAGRLRALADSPEDREALGRRLRGRFEAEYTIERHVDRLEALYRDVTSIDQRSTGSSRAIMRRPGRRSVAMVFPGCHRAGWGRAASSASWLAGFRPVTT